MSIQRIEISINGGRCPGIAGLEIHEVRSNEKDPFVQAQGY
jgi:hypothetical protein